MNHTIRDHVRSVIDQFEADGEPTSPTRVRDVVVDRFSDEIDSYARLLAEGRVRDIARDMLTADSRRSQQPIEGLELPRWITNPDGEGDYVHVPLKVATMAQYDTYIENVLLSNVKSASAELQKHRRQYRTLAVDHITGDTLVIDAAEHLVKGSAA